jgi:hypothetical protein
MHIGICYIDTHCAQIMFELHCLMFQTIWHVILVRNWLHIMHSIPQIKSMNEKIDHT